LVGHQLYDAGSKIPHHFGDRIVFVRPGAVGRNSFAFIRAVQKEV
jgi:hypothetical protein